MPEDLGGDKRRDLPGGAMMQYMHGPRAEHRVERVSPENRPALPSREREQPEPDWRPAEDPQQQARRWRRRLIIAAIVGAVLLLAASVLGWYWYTTWRWLESTDDAYTQADNTAVIPGVSGYISELLVTDNQRVKAGEVLVRIETADIGLVGSYIGLRLIGRRLVVARVRS